MATESVPGAVPANRDVLAAGCWAEHPDGSLVLVTDLTDSVVTFEVYDPAKEPGKTLRSTMDEATFKRELSWPSIGENNWKWHDKSPFPWQRVMHGMRDETAAARLLARKGIDTELVAYNPPPSLAQKVWARIQGAIGRAKS